jgi:hypothetical protein
LALDWNDQRPIKDLTRLSFEIHANEYATQFPECEFRRLETLCMEVNHSKQNKKDPVKTSIGKF